jgi:hypothetical protein
MDFQVDAQCNSNAIIYGKATPGGADLTGTFKFLPQQSYIRSEHPERDPAIMIAQLSNREYLSEGLNYETFRADIPKNLTTVNIPILRAGSKMPSKVDFGFINTANNNSHKDVMSFEGFGIYDLNFNVNGPFPNVIQLTSSSGTPLKPWSESMGPFERIKFYLPLYNQMDTFQIDKFGESYNNETTFDPVYRINPYVQLIEKCPFTKPTTDMLKSAVDLFDKRQVFTTIFQPSNLMDGSAYPVVEGSLDLQIKFSSPLANDITLYMCLQYWQQTILHEDHTCEIQNITLENFRTAPISSPSLLPPPPAEDDEYMDDPTSNQQS